MCLRIVEIIAEINGAVVVRHNRNCRKEFMKYSVASNFDNKYITTIASLKGVESVYGKLPHDIIGGGR